MSCAWHSSTAPTSSGFCGTSISLASTHCPSPMFSVTSATIPFCNSSRSPGFRVIRSIMSISSEEGAEILGQQHVLVQQNLAPRDLPSLGRFANEVGALADEGVGLVLD